MNHRVSSKSHMIILQTFAFIPKKRKHISAYQSGNFLSPIIESKELIVLIFVLGNTEQHEGLLFSAVP